MNLNIPAGLRRLVIDAAVAPAIEPVAPWRVRSVESIGSMRLRVTFVDGTVGEVDMTRFLADQRIRGTLFEQLRDPARFAQATVVLGAVRWPNGADLAPDAMYDAIQERGCWAVD